MAHAVLALAVNQEVHGQALKHCSHGHGRVRGPRKDQSTPATMHLHHLLQELDVPLERPGKGMDVGGNLGGVGSAFAVIVRGRLLLAHLEFILVPILAVVSVDVLGGIKLPVNFIGVPFVQRLRAVLALGVGAALPEEDKTW